MVKVFKAIVINPVNGLEDIVSMSAKNIKELTKKLEVRNYKVKKVIGEL